MTNVIDAQTAREIINRLKAGTSPIEYVEHLNVGNERWYEKAGEYFDDLQNSRGSLVRFIKGYYGDGKTHFLGMLRAIAFNKKWMVSYVTAEKTPLNRFDSVYSEVVKNMTLPPNAEALDWVMSREVRGPRALLGATFSKICREAYPPSDISALKKPSVVEFLKARSAELAYGEVMEESVGKAVRGYTDAVLVQNMARIQDITSWLQGGQIKIPELGINKPIGRVMARDAMRGISLIAQRAGISGILILFDEAERIMKQSKSVRTSSYGIIKDLLDNADQQGGMQSSIMYVAGTPEMFSDEKGFAENDALRSRLEIAGRFAMGKYTDYRSVIVDLTKTPLDHELLVRLAGRIRSVHAIARNWNPENYLTEKAIEETVCQVEQGIFQISKPRMLAASIATLLDTAEQNREADVLDLISQVLKQVHSALPKEPKTGSWE
jgi:hypothetical protein